eukprot:CAMPEP_0116142552 /NCGR_PEP_ID=MMETSP0329-20121206/14970_1 /TAXON_ID=697910 /ORGANISM="Pseudo-nitzschia arenysensis, Strain B593" /LENGTH=490 /DNA_ID=CAMNT_0003637797 /DNA_START=72 /DNA_END=1544 /DNA_ORIENTATION=-
MIAQNFNSSIPMGAVEQLPLFSPGECGSFQLLEFDPFNFANFSAYFDKDSELVFPDCGTYKGLSSIEEQLRFANENPIKHGERDVLLYEENYNITAFDATTGVCTLSFHELIDSSNKGMKDSDTSNSAASVTLDYSIPNSNILTVYLGSSKSCRQWTEPVSSGWDAVSIPRYPVWNTLGGLLRAADYIGVLSCSISGTVVAAQSGLDVFGSMMVGVITSIGGGTTRDLILNVKPFWTEETEYIWIGSAASLITFFLWPRFVLKWRKTKQQKSKGKRSACGESDRSRTMRTFESDILQAVKELRMEESETSESTDLGEVQIIPSTEFMKEETAFESDDEDGDDAVEKYDIVDGIMDILDAIGLSAFAVFGTQKAMNMGMPMLVSAICGMITATFGGVIRDFMCRLPVRIVHSHSEVYASPALAGATVFLASEALGGAPVVMVSMAFLMCMGSRFLALRYNFQLQTWDTDEDNLGVTVRKRPTRMTALFNSK